MTRLLQREMCKRRQSHPVRGERALDEPTEQAQDWSTSDGTAEPSLWVTSSMRQMSSVCLRGITCICPVLGRLGGLWAQSIIDKSNRANPHSRGDEVTPRQAVRRQPHEGTRVTGLPCFWSGVIF